MHKPNDWDSEKQTRFAWNPILLFGFGIAILMFLVAIDHPNWFHIKPMTGTAVAMSYTADQPAAPPVGR